ncbi:MAG: DNA-directed RNA polymerase subunit K [Nitrososphaeraceae archaeon]|nr:DNA-directed RNA polymerase subunit K [Nitrososphaeraceae archaeon]MDW0136756.1 DNA-directed RNA polymerase subunit K [Nitrososphaeraceae archaeon]MDW0142697.1 DNA-directed RNA polymerase subunit K [Nitrososphaeraceae archaeon]MDW0146300.1 DNA-directed RNA polymerase subunit K [Nitrososphaeraceae archaeon]MDW0153922.1 DNA-directed RNA polymerase subunit K [Nitrososphaeraceae archaeon]
MVLRRSSAEKNKGKKLVKVKKQPKVKKDTETKGKSSQEKEKKSKKTKIEILETEEESKSGRPKDEVVVYPEMDFEAREITPQDSQVLIGPPTLTRFERARIIGSRSLQLSLGAPILIDSSKKFNDTISIAVAELDLKVLPISIRRVLPNGLYQDIPIDWLK